MFAVIPSTANVAMPAGRPERRMSATPVSRAKIAPAAAASASEGTVETCVCRSQGYIAGSTKFFCSAPRVRIPDR